MRAPISNGLFSPPATMLGSLSGFDGVDTNYSFGIYEIWAIPSAFNAVYMFCKLEGSVHVPLYIGRAENLANRLSGHERLEEAIFQGATHLLVHAPGHAARVGFIEAERRLIIRYNPPLNTQHRSLSLWR
ncbi:MAG: hypothetical protein JJ902_08605 [Roseibium sp.]|nr:hypothetical protein [Roseibium sp.]